VEGGFEFPGARTGEKRSNRGDGNEKNERARECASDFLREKATIEYVDTKEPHHLSDGEACVRTRGAEHCRYF
jgi:hypothetical protein